MTNHDQKSPSPDKEKERKAKKPKYKENKFRYKLIVDEPPQTSETMNRDNPLNLRDQEGYRQELELMKQAHKVMLRNIYSQNIRKKQPDVNAEDRYYDFLNFNTVKEMIDGYL